MNGCLSVVSSWNVEDCAGLVRVGGYVLHITYYICVIGREVRSWCGRVSCTSLLFGLMMSSRRVVTCQHVLVLRDIVLGVIR